MKIDSYYNFVLEEGYSMIINGTTCITLGHELKGDVVEHEYFGTQAIVEDLSRIQGWSNGFVVIQSKSFQRDPVTHKVIGMAH